MSANTGIEWTDVPGWPDVKVSHDGKIMGPSGKILRPYVAPEGHLHVLIRHRKLRVHHAVLLAFVGPRPSGALGRHLNDIPSDNRVENLAWGTSFDNAADRLRNRGWHRGQAAGSPLTVEQVGAIRSDVRSARIVGAEYGVSHTTVLKIRRGERWAAA